MTPAASATPAPTAPDARPTAAATPPTAEEMKCTLCGLSACWMEKDTPKEA